MATGRSLSYFVDANVFLRYFTGDDPEKAKQALALFNRADQGQLQLVTSESVVAEVVYVLSSRTLYRVPRERIALLLRSLLESRGLRIEHKTSVLDALTLYESSQLDFEDCLSVQHVRRLGLAGIYTYDRGFDSVAGLQRLEP